MKKIKYLVFAMILSIPIMSVFANQPNNTSGYARIRLDQNVIFRSLQNVTNGTQVTATYGQDTEEGFEEIGTVTISGAGLYSDGNDTIYVPNGNDVTITGTGVNAGYTPRIIKNGTVTDQPTASFDNITGSNTIDVKFLVNAYLVWSCGDEICYSFVTNLSNNVTFKKDSLIKDDRDDSKKFNVHAREKFFAPYDKFMARKDEIDANSVAIESLIGEDGIDYMPVGEPRSNNAYTSYGNRSFKITIYNSDYRGISMGSLEGLTYYPSVWTDDLARIESYDISGTTKENPIDIDTVLLEPIVKIKALNEYNDFSISKIEPLDVPNGAVTINKNNTTGDYEFSFSSNFYDNVIFKVTGSDNKVFYMRINRMVLSTVNEKMIYSPNVDSFDVFTNFYFDRTTSYLNYILKAKIEYKDGTTKIVNMVNAKEIDDGFQNITYEYELDDEENEYMRPKGKGLKISTYKYTFSNGEIKKVNKMYITVEKAGNSNMTSYAGAFSGSGKGLVITFEEGRRNEEN